MRIVMFYHSILSDWNHGNAHFLRGTASELLARGHHVSIYEPLDSWSLTNLTRDHGMHPVRKFLKIYPGLRVTRYSLGSLRLDEALEHADIVLVHEWNDHELVRRMGEHRKTKGDYLLFFHDTHHRKVSDRAAMSDYDLSGYDGVLAFGGSIRDLYLQENTVRNAWTWHEAADIRLFRPHPGAVHDGDLVWIGNWGDDERTNELREFLIEPVRQLGLRAVVYGVRYPKQALSELASAGITYGGWIPNFDVPRVLARFKMTVHIPRKPYTRALPGIPTIRVFEALACKIPLISAPWDDVEGLFTAGRDFLIAHDGGEMKQHIRSLLSDRKKAETIALSGYRTVLARHTCAHRVDELLNICAGLRGKTSLGYGNDARIVKHPMERADRVGVTDNGNAVASVQERQTT